MSKRLKFLTLSGVSDLFFVSESTVRNWANEGKIKCFRTPGDHRRFKSKDVLRFIEESSIPEDSMDLDILNSIK